MESIELSVTSDGYYAVISYDSIHKKRTNNQDKISMIVDSLNIKATKAIYDSGNLKLFYGQDSYLILDNYKKYKNRLLYKKLSKAIVDSTNIVKTTSSIKKIAFKSFVFATLFTSAISLTKNIKIDVSDTVDNISTDNYDTNDTNTILKPLLSDFYEINKKEYVEDICNLDINDETLENDFSSRLQTSIDIYNKVIPNNNIYPIGERLNSYEINNILDFSSKEEYSYFTKYAAIYGIDPYLLLALADNESSLNHYDNIPGGSKYRNHAVGITQQEDPILYEREVGAYNYETNNIDKINLNMENAIDIEKNIQMAAMILQNLLQKYKNPYIAIQAYNYSESVMDILISRCASDNNYSIDDILLNPTLLNWYIKDMHNNPLKYINSWSYSTYGNDNYISSVLGLYVGSDSRYLVDGELYNCDLLTGNITKEKVR